MSKIALISAVLNEGSNIRALLESIERQTCCPDEVIFVEGGSTDNTLAILQEFQTRLPLKILVRPNTNISQARNHAIRATTSDIIAATDAGLVLADDWLELLTQPLLDNPELGVVGGFFKVDAHSYFEMAMGAAVTRLLDEINPNTFLPGSRSIAYRKSVWEAVGGYPEWLDYGEDLVFIMHIKALIGHFEFRPAVVHFRPRESFREFFKQYYHYARGDGKADLWRLRHFIRYITYLVFLPLFLTLGFWFHPLYWLGLVASGGFYLRKPYRRLRSEWQEYHSPLSERLVTVLLLPPIRFTGDIAKMVGYPIGVWWRLHQRGY
jgi:glycosyltransferase involved in cell wall biosynthesis